ncbi:MAG: bifunctional enoyl-CoA hydratase/phosphate acetyltransferase [Spirochaetes bacterium]|nr:bifunctional enoyl-CoA hydratase/phosphate acetyltransferase [Spirochaetota bacterium]
MVFKDLFEKIKSTNLKTIAIAGCEKDEVIIAAKEAIDSKIAKFVLVGDKEKGSKVIKDLGYDLSDFEIIDEKDDSLKAQKVCEFFRDNKVDLIMKGTVPTGTLLKKVLDKEFGLRVEPGFLSHIACIEWENRLLGITDGGLNILPTIEEKISIIKNAINFYNKIGIQNPKIALVSAVEIPSSKMQSTIDAAIIAKMAERGDIKGGLIDGPFGFDNAISKKAAEMKGIKSPIAGEADIIVAPNIEAANMCAKGIIYATGFKNGGVIVGSKAPIILLSRADDAQTKLNSIALALAAL